MKIILSAAAAFGVVLLAAGAVQAQPYRQAGPPAMQRQAPDANRDGRLTYEEMRARAHARFARLDVNRDGRLTREEVRESRQDRRGDRVERRFGEDGVMTREEFRRRADERFARLDANRDGRLTPEEMRSQRQERRMARGGRQRQGGGMRLGRMMGLDGVVTLAEIDANLRQRFERRDRNDDGALTPDERGGRRMMMRQNRRPVG